VIDHRRWPRHGRRDRQGGFGCRPRRFIAGADAIATGEQKITDLKAQIEAHRELSMSLAFN
jgi:hypothetical protein